MKLTFDEMLVRAGLDRQELATWIQEGWIAPARDGDTYVFEDVDIARVGFICEMTRDLMIDEESMPVILSLVDQVNTLRETFKKVLLAVEDLPEPARSRIAAIVAELDQA